MFQQNVKRAPITVKNSVGASLVGTLGVTAGGLLMLATGYCWTADISSLGEFQAQFQADAQAQADAIAQE